MSPAELVDAVHALGGQIRQNGNRLKIDAPKGSLTPELVEELRERKPGILDYLRLAESCRRIEEMQLAIRIREKDGNRGWWLVVASTARSEVDDDMPIYTAEEWLKMVTSGLSHDEIRTLDRDVKQFKSVCGGEVVRIDLHGNKEDADS